MHTSNLHLGLVVGNNGTQLGIDQEEFARTKTTFFFNLFRFKDLHTDLGTHNNHVVFGNDVAAGTQTVAVQSATNVAAIGEYEGCGTIPWLHDGGVILIVSLEAVGDGVFAIPTLGHHHCEGLRHGATGLAEELEYVVERSRVTHVGLHNWENLLKVVAKEVALENAFASLHPKAVTSDGVDLTVVGQHTERLSEVPSREGIG